MELTEISHQFDSIVQICGSIFQVKVWIGQWEISSQKYQNLLRALYDAFVAAKQRFVRFALVTS